MTTNWEGFTEEELKQIRHNTGKEEIPLISHEPKQQPRMDKSFKKNFKRERMLLGKEPCSTKVINDQQSSLAPTAFFSKSKESEHKEVPAPGDGGSDSGCSLNETPAATPDQSPSHGTVCLHVKEDGAYELLNVDSKQLKARLGNFQERQKMMEEQNKKRREMLAVAIMQRKKQTDAESSRLQHIQVELNKLDSSLSSDVGILRNQIEVASIEFNEAQKRYAKAEKEFLDAKVKLFDKLQRKELLTEHLCTIIEQNEMRKARKLSELMEKLNVCSWNENEEQILPQVPSVLYDVDDTSYAACTTLKNPKDLNKNDSTAQKASL